MEKNDLRKLEDALLDADNWSPNLTKISKITGIPVSTVHDRLKKINGEDGLRIVFRVVPRVNVELD